MPPQALLYSVEPDGPRPLDLSSCAGSPAHLYDDLPLGIYEALRTFDGRSFFGLEEHLVRAEASMRRLGWSETLDRPALLGSLASTLSTAPYADSRVRFDVLARPTERFGEQARVLLLLMPLDLPPDKFVDEGVDCPLVHDLHRKQPLIKTADFTIARRRHPSGTQDCYEPIMVSEGGVLLECTSANFMAVRDGALLLAPGGVLEGVTQAYHVELARAAGIEVREEAVRETDIAQLDEAFLCSSIRSLVPIVKIAGQVVGDGKPGPVSRRLLEDYLKLAGERATEAL